jgi:hypothetical protein
MKIAVGQMGRRTTHLVVLIACSVVVLVAWAGVVLTPGHLLQVDFAFPLNPDAVLDDFRAAWKPSFGSNVIASTRLVAGGLPALIIHGLGLDSSVMVKSIVALHLLVALGGMYGLVVWTLPADRNRRWSVMAGAFVAGLYVSLNVWAVAHVHQVFMFTQYAATPLILGLWILALQRRRPVFALLAALTFALIGATNPHFAMFNMAVLVIASVVVGARTMRWGQFGRIIGAFALAGLLLGAFFLLPLLGRFFYGGELVPTFDSTVPGVESLTAEQTPGNTLGLVGSAFFSTRARPTNPGLFAWQPLAAAPFVLVAAAVLRPSPSRRIAVLMFIIVVLGSGVQLASWWNVTRDAFAEAVRVLPLGWVFREPERLGGMMAVAYGWGLAYWVAVLLGWDQGLQSLGALRGYVRVPVSVILVAAVAWPSAYFDVQMIWSRDGFSWRPIEVPVEFDEMTTRVEGLIEDDEWLLIVSPGLRDPLWNSDRTVAPFEAFTIRGRHRVVDPNAAPSEIEVFLRSPNSATVQGLLDLGISRVLLVHDYTAGQRLRDRFDQADVVEPELTGEWMTLYSLDGQSQPLLSLELDGMPAAAAVTWSKPSLTEYAVQIPASHSNRRLIVRERFDAGWVLEADGLSLAPDPAGDAELMRQTQLSYVLPPGPAIDATISFAGVPWYLAGISVSAAAGLVLVGGGTVWLWRCMRTPARIGGT